MRSYHDLTPKEKFIRTCIAVPVCWALMTGIRVFCSQHFILGTGWIIKFAAAAVIIVILSFWQIITTYLKWKDDENNY